ncbi:PEF-CTERM sorting domain-containing protein [Methanolobus bombayensis]|uniref:PEF-CTERM sorting domain-containing protein n=1 Tax=Methanolobus bombayensis TaxID=38023 RepID=UPI001AE9A01F|nr:PEF-CTERM sorting domain-containing protein [Methanolobus bombayensis]MBP1908505.1 hypothetical protein [Methanolobus bombayensis]
MKRILVSILVLMLGISLAIAASEDDECTYAGCEGASYTKFDGWSGVLDGNTQNGVTIHDATMVSFNWSSTNPVCAVYVKAGTNNNTYTYGCDNPAYSDNNLVSPTTQDISHVTFCFCDGGEEIPEFPTIALSVAAIIGLAFFFRRRKD